MTVMLDTLLALLPASSLGSSLFFWVRGGGKLVRRRWRSGFADWAVSLGLVVLGLGLAALILSVFVVRPEALDPSHAARHVGEFIAATMNCGAVMGLLALIAGFVDTLWLERRRERP